MSVHVTSYQYSDEGSFISYNPWFHLALENRISRMIESDRLRQRIRSEMNDQFGTMWRNHVYNDVEYRNLVSRLTSTTDTSVARVQNAADVKVSELMNNGQLEPIKISIHSAAMQKYAMFESYLQTQFDHNERNRNERLANTESDVAALKNGQLWTLLGGVAFGLGLGLFATRK